ncbi:hypothetical protein NDU88_002384 [Pleurodeles waltl]|uniref:Uncharacterized protein n=1 Tax=Pleurodeles waltl TaxID=8319 RepID=A0AAV7Q9Q9_PLEWA|nr:hypothetical protein NDU88_002384 [Pleurodeles waltl]
MRDAARCGSAPAQCPCLMGLTAAKEALGLPWLTPPHRSWAGGGGRVPFLVCHSCSAAPASGLQCLSRGPWIPDGLVALEDLIGWRAIALGLSWPAVWRHFAAVSCLSLTPQPPTDTLKLRLPVIGPVSCPLLPAQL